MKKHAATFILLICSALFAAGLFELFQLRFESGDVYPAYSSLRSDPLGTMALFESLARMPGLTLVRDFSSENRLPPGRGATYLHLAASREEWLWLPEEVVQEIQGFVLNGGRLVIAFLPETSRPFSRVTTPPPGKTAPPKPAPGSKAASESPLLKDRWGVEIGFKALPEGDAGKYEPVSVRKRSELPVPDTLDWHSGLIFTNLNSAWEAVYSRGTNPVVIERRFASGSVVILTDCFFLSNEAMVQDRHPDLLAWLVGSAHTILFDEAHLGLTENPGVVSLMRKYRLHGLIAGIVLLVGLFIWKYSVSFTPRLGESAGADEIAGKEAAAGFVNLLRRNIAPRDVLGVCFDQWTRTFARRGAVSITRVDQIQAVFAAEAARAKSDQDPVRAYQEIQRVLKSPAIVSDSTEPIPTPGNNASESQPPL